MVSFGDELRREREVRGVKLSDISASTRVNIKFLKALEENRFSEIPGGVFTKGIIKAYANHLGIDAEETLNAYSFELAKRQNNGSPKSSGTNSPKRWWERLFSGRR